MKMPWFKFFPADWKTDSELARCSLSARGLLIELLGVMHSCPDRGRLATAGTPWTDEEIAQAGRCQREEGVAALNELLSKGVLSRDENGCVFSRKMVRDSGLSAVRADAGALGGVAKAKQKASKHPSKPLTSDICSSDSSSGGEECREGEGAELDRQAEELVKIYPKEVSRVRGFQAARAAIMKERKIRPDAFPYLKGRTEAYRQSWAGNQGRFTPNPETWFGEGRYNENEREWTKSEPGRSGETKEHVTGKIRTVLRVRSSGIHRSVL